MLRTLSSESVGEIVNFMNTMKSSREDASTPSIKSTFSYAEKKPGSAFSYVVPPKKRFRESVNNIIHPETSNTDEIIINVPIDIKEHPNGSISRTMQMTKYSTMIGLANEIDVFYTGNSNPDTVSKLELKFGSICQHIKNCNNKNCSNCIMSKVLKNPDICHRLMNHTLRCNTNQCKNALCHVFKNYMQFKFMMYNPPMNIIESLVIDDNAEKMNKKQKI